MDILSPLNLNLNELQNSKFQSLGSDPGSLVAGQFWFNSTGAGRPKIRLNSGVTFDFTDALTLGGQTSAYHLGRANHTGTQLSATISDFDTQVRTSRLDQMAAPTASVGMGSQKITSLANGTNPADAVNFAQLEAARQGVRGKAAVDAVMTTNVAVAVPGTAVFDGQTLVSGEGLGLFGQTVGSENGIYVFNGSASALTRRDDADVFGELDSGAEIYAQGGSANLGVWRQTTELTAFTGQTWIKVNGGTTYTAGSGLAESPAGTFNVGGTTNRISVSADTIDIDASYAGQASIITLGTITTGTWQGTAVAVAFGGTGGTTQATARTGIGAVGKYSATIGNGSLTSIPIARSTHLLAADGTNTVSVYDATSGAQVYPNVTVAPGSGDVTVAFSVAPTTNQYRVVIVG